MLGFLKRVGTKREAQDLLVAAVSDGVVTAQEIEVIYARLRAAGAAPTDVWQARVKAFEHLATLVAQNEPNEAGEQRLKHGQYMLGLPEDAALHGLRTFSRARFLADVRAGRLPVIPPPPGLVLKPGEVVHLAADVEMLEEQVVDRRYVGRSAGVSVRIAKGVTVRTGSSRGRLVVDKGIVVTARGIFAVTNLRLVFFGDSKSWQAPFNKLTGLEISERDVGIADSRGKIRIYRLPYGADIEVVEAVINGTLYASGHHRS